jgi:hypothetical protein
VGIRSRVSEYAGAGVGGSRAYRSEERVLVVAKWALGQWAVRCWRIEDGGDGDRAADGARKRRPPGPMFTPASPASLRLSPEQGCDGRGQNASSQCGDEEGRGMWSFGAARSCFEIREGRIV